ncbi:MAG: Rap1a/Tai family immunity protein [Alphaproteobacteria bacterium]|nr:Rap1a/Tai family immunity protein [Alphaproteobacteria bacterium]
MKEYAHKWRLWVAALLLCGGLLGAPQPAAAMYVAGGDLVKNCLSERKQDVYACVHYVAGVIDYHTVMQAVGTAPTLAFCLPANVGITEAAFVVLTYLRAHPQHDAFVAAMAVPLALNKVYPCRKPAPKASKKK